MVYTNCETAIAKLLLTSNSNANQSESLVMVDAKNSD